MTAWQLSLLMSEPCSWIRQEISIILSEEVMLNLYEVKESYFHLHDQSFRPIHL